MSEQFLQAWLTGKRSGVAPLAPTAPVRDLVCIAIDPQRIRAALTFLRLTWGRSVHLNVVGVVLASDAWEDVASSEKLREYLRDFQAEYTWRDAPPEGVMGLTWDGQIEVTFGGMVIIGHRGGTQLTSAAIGLSGMRIPGL